MLDLVAAAAHDLRTPLTTLLAQAQDVERRTLEEPTRPADPRALRRIAAEARRLSTLIEELVEAAEIEQGRLAVQREPLDLAAVAAHACSSHGQGRAHLEAPAPVVGTWDRRRVGFVLEALIDNAAKYGAEDMPIRVVVWREGTVAYVAVQDRGMGIPEEDLSRIFERFHRGGNVADRAVPGLGLGLYLAKAIARAHRGAIGLHSTPLDGTTVTLALPCDDAALPETIR